MMENFIKPDVFYGAITAYLNKFMYNNAETADLFKIIQGSSPDHLNVTEIMDTWTRQNGFPVVNVKKSGNNYILTQKRFLADSDAKLDLSESEYGWADNSKFTFYFNINCAWIRRYKWTIPVTYITDKMSKPTLVWFDKDDKDCT